VSPDYLCTTFQCLCPGSKHPGETSRVQQKLAYVHPNAHTQLAEDVDAMDAVVNTADENCAAHHVHTVAVTTLLNVPKGQGCARSTDT
jgi:hypothetical protein